MKMAEELRPFHYAVVRTMPDLLRQETVNIGLVLLADDGSFADARFADLGRVVQLSPRVDLRPIAVFEDAVRESLPVTRHQLPLQPPRSQLSVDRLLEWSREFGGPPSHDDPCLCSTSDAPGNGSDR